MLGNHPKERILHLVHGESLKSGMLMDIYQLTQWNIPEGLNLYQQ